MERLGCATVHDTIYVSTLERRGKTEEFEMF